MIRARVAEYVNRFVRIAAAYEDSVLGSTSIGFSMQSFSETGVSTTMIGMGIPQGLGGSLGSGMVFMDDLSKAREMTSNASRIEGWRSTKNYEYWQHVRAIICKLSIPLRRVIDSLGILGLPKLVGASSGQRNGSPTPNWALALWEEHA